MAILYGPIDTNTTLFVEPNHLSAQRNGKIYAQSKFTANSITVSGEGLAQTMLSATGQLNKPDCQNGMFFKIDVSTNEVTNDPNVPGEYLLHFSEIKNYDSKNTMGYFKPLLDSYVDEEYYPRLLKTDIGDTYTTNAVADMVLNAGLKSNNASTGYTDLSVGDFLVVSYGLLVKKAEPAETDMVWQIKEITTAPDGMRDAVKIVRVQ